MATVAISNHISAQGDLVSRNGDMATVRMGDRTVTGRLVSGEVSKPATAPAPHVA